MVKVRLYKNLTIPVLFAIMFNKNGGRLES